VAAATAAAGMAPQEVMKAIAEALVATAVGLFVAIPAVIAYNWFQRHSKRSWQHGRSERRPIGSPGGPGQRRPSVRRRQKARIRRLRLVHHGRQ